MKIVFNTYPWAFDVPGGGEMQLMAYHRYLPMVGATPTLFDAWNPSLDDFDIVHYFSVVGGSVHFCGYVKRLGLPLVVSSSLWITKETRELYPVEEIRAQLALADIVVANADVEGDQLSQVLDLPREKFITVYNGVEDEFLDPADPNLFRQREPGCESFLLTVGNIEPRKNQLSLVRALKRFQDLKLVLIGYVRDPVYADQCFREGKDQIVYLGPLPHSAALLRAAMAACDAFVIPSTLETPSLAALEAAAQGARVLINEVGSTREYFGDLATYLNPNDVDSIAEGIAKVLSSARSSDELRDKISSNFTWRRVLPSLTKAYGELLNRMAP
jgi:glycosyltransferase involved in cell wall biosynthesis